MTRRVRSGRMGLRARAGGVGGAPSAAAGAAAAGAAAEKGLWR